MTLANRDDVTYDGEIIEHPAPGAPLTLFGTDDPAAVVERATRVATVLADVIRQRNLQARIGNRDHIMLEGWTLLGSMLGVFGETEWTRPTADGWEARAVARTMSGVTVGAAEAMCTRTERTWKSRDEYAIRSMAQTRALSKALRLPLGFIVELAGFAATPAEEMEQSERSDSGQRAVGAARSSQGRTASAAGSAPTPKNKGEALSLLADVGHEHGLSFAQIEAKAKAMGVDRGSATVEDILRVIAAIETPASGVPADVAGTGEAEVARAAASPTIDAASGEHPAPAGSDAATPAGGSSPAADPGTPTDEQILAAAGEGAEIVAPDYATDPDGYRAWYDALPSGERATLRGESRSPRQLADAAKAAAKPDAEALRMGLES